MLDLQHGICIGHISESSVLFKTLAKYSNLLWTRPIAQDRLHLSKAIPGVSVIEAKRNIGKYNIASAYPSHVIDKFLSPTLAKAKSQLLY